MLYYPVTERQLRALTDWGTTTANRRAYNTLASVIAADFDLPRDFTHARNANGRVVMGLHGNRIGTGEYGRAGYDRGMLHRHPFGHGFLGWTPRHQEGHHLRRIGGQLWYPADAPMVAVRPDGRQKPGELQTGGYGFYYKGTPQGAVQGAAPKEDVLAQLQTVVRPIPVPERPNKLAVPYDNAITSDVYFTNDKWQSILRSHGIVVDADKKTLTIQSSAEQADFVYDLTDEEVRKLTDKSVKNTTIADRLDVINNVIKSDFAEQVTIQSLNSDQPLDIKLKPELRQDMFHQQQATLNIATVQAQQQNQQLPSAEQQAQMDRLHEGHPDIGAAIDGRDLYELEQNKGWFREGQHGREVSVERISVEPSREVQGKYTMTAVINGETVTHDISTKEYNKFLAVNDLQRMKMFSKIFSEVDMKDIQSTGTGTRIAAGILAALTVGTGVVAAGLGSRPRPEYYGSCHGQSPRVYYKPGVDSPEDIAARNYDAQINNPAGHSRGHGM